MTRDERRLTVEAPKSVTTEMLVRVICSQSSSHDLVAKAAQLVALIAKADEVLLTAKLGTSTLPQTLIEAIMKELPQVETALRSRRGAHAPELASDEMADLIADGCARLAKVLVPTVIDWPKEA
jgi:hypothetical protein